jgi:hypothetical protein
VNNKLEWIWEEVIVTEFDVLPRYLPGVIEGNNKNSRHIWCPGRDTNHVPPKCNSQVLLTKPVCSINHHAIQLLWFEKRRAKLSIAFWHGSEAWAFQNFSGPLPVHSVMQ